MDTEKDHEDCEESGGGSEEEDNSDDPDSLYRAVLESLIKSKPCFGYQIDHDKTLIFGAKIVHTSSLYLSTVKNWVETYHSVKHGKKRQIIQTILNDLVQAGCQFYQKSSDKRIANLFVPVQDVAKIEQRIARDLNKLSKENKEVEDLCLAAVDSCGSSQSEGLPQEEGQEEEEVVANAAADAGAHPPVPHVNVPKRCSEGSSAGGCVAANAAAAAAAAAEEHGDDVSSIHEISIEMNGNGSSRRSAASLEARAEKQQKKRSGRNETDHQDGAGGENPQSATNNGVVDPLDPTSVLPPTLTRNLESWSRRQLAETSHHEEPSCELPEALLEQEDGNIAAAAATGGDSAGVDREGGNKSNGARRRSSRSLLEGDEHSVADVPPPPPPPPPAKITQNGGNSKQPNMQLGAAHAQQQPQIDAIIAAMKAPPLASVRLLAHVGSPPLQALGSPMAMKTRLPLLPRPMAAVQKTEETERPMGAQDWIQVGTPAAGRTSKRKISPFGSGTSYKRTSTEHDASNEVGVEPTSLLMSESIGTMPPPVQNKRPRRSSSAKSSGTSSKSVASSKGTANTRKKATTASKKGKKKPASSSSATGAGSRASAGTRNTRAAAAGRSKSASGAASVASGRTAAPTHNGMIARSLNGAQYTNVMTEMMGRLQSVEQRLASMEGQNRRFRQRLADLEEEEDLRANHGHGSHGSSVMASNYQRAAAAVAAAAGEMPYADNEDGDDSSENVDDDMPW